jgi:hypothetical protein
MGEHEKEKDSRWPALLVIAATVIIIGDALYTGAVTRRTLREAWAQITDAVNDKRADLKVAE